MKKFLTLLLMVITLQLYAQDYMITGINVNISPYPDANTANWGSGVSVFTISAATTMNNLKAVMDSKMLVTIKKGGSKVCGSYTNATAPASNFNTVNKVWSGRNAVSFLGQDCILKPGEYEICVQFFNSRNNVISEEKNKPFTIKGEEQQTYQPPQAISPADGLVISGADAQKPVTFRWTPVTPKPRGEVIYKVRVFEIKKGQTATASVRTANPLFEKEVTNQNQLAGVFLSQLIIADDSQYGWYVQALDQMGNPMGGNNGMSELYKFFTSVNNYGINDDGIKNAPCECRGWIEDKPVLIQSSTGQPIGNVLCGNTIQLGNTGTYQITAPDYICSPTTCQVTYIWEVDPPGSPNVTGSGNPFTYNFSTAGSYTIIITPNCGNQKCPPCKFEIIIKQEDCKCEGWRDKLVLIQSGTGQNTSVNCGGIAQLTGTGSYTLTAPVYICAPMTCQATYNWEIQGPGLLTGASTGNQFPFNFSASGSYTVIITPNCGNQKCPPCKFEIIIKQEDCKCRGWVEGKPVLIQSGTGQTIGNVNCGGTYQLPSTGNYTLTAPDYLCFPTSCQATYTWQVDGPGTVDGSGPGQSFSFNFSVVGQYTVIFTPTCGNDRCPPCKFVVYIKENITCDCKGAHWKEGMPAVINSGTNSWDVNCNSSIGLAYTGLYQITAPDFICNPASCQPTYTWQVNGPGTVDGSGPGQSFSFNFSVVGQYTVIFTPTCGNDRCPPCKFIINIKQVPCDCKGTGWVEGKPVLIQSGTEQTIGNVNCGGTYQLPGTGNYTLTAPDYFCFPASCQATYTWQVQGPGSNGSGSGKPFTFNFSAQGQYIATIYAYCGPVKCDSCKITLIIREDCKCRGWKEGVKPAALIQSSSGQTVAHVSCGGTTQFAGRGTYQITGPEYICSPATCQATYTWQVDGPGSVDGNGPGKPFTFNFSALGQYSVVIYAYCGSQKCDSCKFGIKIVKGIPNNIGIEILTPKDTLDNPKPTFEWKPSGSIPKDIRYTIKIFPIFENQKTEDAINTNKVFWEVSNIKETLLLYPSDATPLDSGQIYAWTVDAMDSKGKIIGKGISQLVWDLTPQPMPCMCMLQWPTPQTIFYKCQSDAAFPIQPPGTLVGLCPGGKQYEWKVNGTVVSNSNTPLQVDPASLLLFPQTNVITWQASSGGVIKCSGNYTVTVYPQLTAEIYEWLPGVLGNTITNICVVGAEATLYVPNLPTGYNIEWSWIDSPGGNSGTLGISNPINDSPIPTSGSCPPGQQFFTRTYSANIIGTPLWPASCFPADVTLTVWCPSVSGTIIVNSSPHTLQPGNKICSAPQGYNVNLSLTLSGNVGNIISWSRNPGSIPPSPGLATISDVIDHADVYTYTVTVQNGPPLPVGCSPATAVIEVTVEDPLTATITSIIPMGTDPLWVCPNDAAQLQLNTQPVGTNILWEYQINCTGNWFPAGSALNQNTNQIGNQGPYNPIPTQSLCWRATVSPSSNICGPITSDIFHILLYPPPSQPTITLINGALPKCPGDHVLLNASTPTSGNPLFTYQWYRDGVLLAGETNQQINATGPGYYTVEVWADGHCISAISLPFKVTNCEMAPTIDGPCATNGSTTITLTAQPNSYPNPSPQVSPPCNGPYSYTWSTGGNIIATTQSVSVTPTVTTEYCVEIIDGLGCHKSVCITIKVCP